MRSVLWISLLLAAAAIVGVAEAALLPGRPSDGIPYKRGVLFTKRDIDAPPYAQRLLGRLDSVASFDDLKTHVGVSTALIAIDQSALGDVPRTFLRQQLANGVTLMGLNVTRSDLVGASDLIGLMTSINEYAPPDWAQPNAPYAEPYYSFVRLGLSDGQVRSGNLGQKDFRGTARVSLFAADLGRMLAATSP